MKKIFLVLIIVMAICIYFICAQLSEVYALSRYGSTGNEVKQIQTKLKAWGYYSGSVDGIYGSKTYEAVRKFQSKNGLTVDGIAGPKTLAALGINSNSSSGTSSNNSDLNLLSHLVYRRSKGRAI